MSVPARTEIMAPGFTAGTVIAGKYRVDRLLGMGGMGVVVAVTHLELGLPYAIKYLQPHCATDADMVARFLREARASVRIASDHVARVSDVGRLPDGAPFLVMEYLTGVDLGQHLARVGRLRLQDAADFVLQACSGVAEAHALGIIHRDLKPGNLFLTTRSDGSPLVKVLDFGIAKLVDEARGGGHLTSTTVTIGSPSYMSPEQVRSSRDVDYRTDIWSLGVILYNLLTRRLPFEGETTSAVLAAIAADRPLPMRVAYPDLPPSIESVVFRCLEKDRLARFQTVAEVAEALAPFTNRSIASLGRIRRLVHSIPDASPSSPVEVAPGFRSDEPTATIPGREGLLASLPPAPTSAVIPVSHASVAEPSVRIPGVATQRRHVVGWLLACLVLGLGSATAWTLTRPPKTSAIVAPTAQPTTSTPTVVPAPTNATSSSAAELSSAQAPVDTAAAASAKRAGRRVVRVPQDPTAESH